MADDMTYLSTIPTVPSDTSEECRLSDQAVGDSPTTRQSFAECESASLNQSMSAEDRIMDYLPVLSVSAHHAMADGSDAPQAGKVDISTSGLPAYSPTWHHGQCNMTLRPSESRADHQEAVCVKEESEIDHPAADQLAQSSEVRPWSAPGVCSMVCSCGGVNPYERRGTQPPKTSKFLATAEQEEAEMAAQRLLCQSLMPGHRSLSRTPTAMKTSAPNCTNGIAC
ncbi:hypothetical protein HPB51_015626 [Rhipicephalus microplus]|uniref:Uncharacterized protein n=1 Tax=Rhipicephalus microplus TaxID=6941 RepID=A0A9J6EI59_RHIMP|nr:hypothetical protein HPB51_015626 [Rhipicephalus microplus]